jgi:8-oxo-dGTP pyrophosphatase MutT (NUDIX family)
VEATDISTPREKLYVLGIIIEPKTRRVALLRKKRPLWQQGLLNGIGGHIEAGELPSEAMARECQEEVGLILEEDRSLQNCIVGDVDLLRLHR